MKYKFWTGLLFVLLIGTALAVFASYGDYDMTGEFHEQIENNPIDRDYETEWRKLGNSPDFSTQASVELESKYIAIWDKELNSIYQKLIKSLEEEEKVLLRESQRGWLQYHDKQQEFVWRYYYGRKSGAILGSQGLVQMRTAYKNRIRERTLELMEYYGEAEFEYKSKT